MTNSCGPLCTFVQKDPSLVSPLAPTAFSYLQRLCTYDTNSGNNIHTIEQFVESYQLAQQPPCSLLDFNLDDLQNYLEKRAKKANLVSFKRLISFLFNTGKIDWDDAEVMRRFLQQR